MALCLILLLDYIPQWITSTCITQDWWKWEIYIFPGLCTDMHKALYHTLVLSYGMKSQSKFGKQSVETFKEKLREHYSRIQNEN